MAARPAARSPLRRRGTGSRCRAWLYVPPSSGLRWLRWRSTQREHESCAACAALETKIASGAARGLAQAREPSSSCWRSFGGESTLEETRHEVIGYPRAAIANTHPDLAFVGLDFDPDEASAIDHCLARVRHETDERALEQGRRAERGDPLEVSDLDSRDVPAERSHEWQLPRDDLAHIERSARDRRTAVQ